LSEAPARQILPDEKRLVESARQGDTDAYRRLVEGYQDRLFGLIFSMVPNREQAEDLTQEVFVKAYFALASFEGGSAFYTWLYRIASNHCLDYLRKRRPAQVSIDRPVKEDSETTFQDTLEAPVSDAPEAPLEASSEAASLLDALDPEQKVILSLRELEGHSYEDLARMLKCPLNTVKSRLNRAREALKIAYEKKYGPVTGPGEDKVGNILDNKIVLESREKP
jgi:RNA polymerase sigma-70 factor (ECF subfamily)